METKAAKDIAVFLSQPPPRMPGQWPGPLAARIFPLFREGLRDLHRNSRRVRVRGVRRHGHDDPVFGERHERRHHPAQRIAVVADHARLFTRQRDGLEVPAKAVTRLLARGQPL